MDAVEVLLREYEIIAAQIEHWDNLFWRTSSFFATLQSVLLAIAGGGLTMKPADDVTIPVKLLVVFVVVAVSNLWLNYVWFRANRRNREYLEVRFARAEQIENEPIMRGVIKTYRLQMHILQYPRHARHSNSQLEMHLPTVFMFAWVIMVVGIVGAAALLDPVCVAKKVCLVSSAALPIVGTFGLIQFVEHTGRLAQRRGTVFATMRAAKMGLDRGGEESSSLPPKN